MVNVLSSFEQTNVTYQVRRSSTFWFWSRIFIKDFYHLWVCRPSWSCDQNNCISFGYLIVRSLSMKFEFNWPKVSGAVVLLLLTFCLLLLPLWGSVVVLCFVVRCFVSVLVLRSSWWGGGGGGGLVALLGLSSWCLVVVGRLFLAVPRGVLQFVIVVFPDHTHLLFLRKLCFNILMSDLG